MLHAAMGGGVVEWPPGGDGSRPAWMEVISTTVVIVPVFTIMCAIPIFVHTLGNNLVTALSPGVCGRSGTVFRALAYACLEQHTDIGSFLIGTLLLLQCPFNFWMH